MYRVKSTDTSLYQDTESNESDNPQVRAIRLGFCD